MESGKSLGTDGLPAEFYKIISLERYIHFFNRRVKYVFHQRLSFDVTEKGELITLLPKKNKPRQYLKNWRPHHLGDRSFLTR